ncbi:MAG: hypothetical protein RLZZ519_559 [Bacteroidota bacterium]|jgi:predicted ATPase
MEKITIKGFGPIKDAEIQVKKLLVLIGEQASGKSTIAKLIYFFKSLPDELYKAFVSSDEEQTTLSSVFEQNCRKLFESRFSQNLNSNPFSIEYSFRGDRTNSLSITWSPSKGLSLTFSSDLVSKMAAQSRNFEQSKAQIKAYQKVIKEAASYDIATQAFLSAESFTLRKNIGELFAQLNTDKFFFIAGRESVETFPEIFERHTQRVQSERIGLADPTPSSFDVELLNELLQRIRNLKVEASRNHQTFKELLNNSLETRSRDVEASEILERINGILRADYQLDEERETLVSASGEKVLLNFGSSGQKESIRIILDLLRVFRNDHESSLRVIEEPEAHLFPIAQKKLIELLVLIANDKIENQVIVTTHSPYVLSTFNNLLFATRVVEKNPAAEQEVSEVAPAAFRIDPSTFSAYSLGNSFDPDQDYCVSIVDPEMGMIDQNYLDTVSDLLGAEFHNLRLIHAKSFSPHGRS